MFLKQVFQCEIWVDVKDGYMGFDCGRDVDFKFKSNRIVCVEINNDVEGEEIGVVVQPHDYFLRTVNGRYPYCVNNIEAEMIDGSDEGDCIYLDVTMWFKSDDLSKKKKFQSYLFYSKLSTLSHSSAFVNADL